MAVVSTNKKLSEISYAANEAITVNPHITLTIDASNTIYPKSITGTSGAIIDFVNQSTTQIICFTLYGANSSTYQLNVSAGAMIRARGKMLTVHTGTGMANQVIDFTVGELAKVPYPSLVLIEHSAGSGAIADYTDNNGSQYLIYPIICTAGKPKIFAPTDVSNGECGRVLFWDATNRKLSCGDGTRGNVIPTGCKVIIPNIYIHGNGAIADSYASRAQLICNNGGHLDLECIAFSDAIDSYSTVANGSIKFSKVGVVGGMYHVTQYPMSVSYLVANACCNWQTVLPPAAMQLYCFNKSTIKDITAVTSRSIYSLTAAAQASALGAGLNGSDGSSISNVYSAIIGNKDANHYAIWLNGFCDSYPKNITAINGQIRFNSLNKNINASDLKHASTLNGALSPVSDYAMVISGSCVNITITDLKRVGVAVRNSHLIIIETGAKNINLFLDQSNYALNDSSTSTSLINNNGTDCEIDVINATTSITGSPSIVMSTYAINSTVRIKGNVGSIAKLYPSSGCVYDGVSCLPENIITSFTGIQSYCAAYLLALSNNPSSGWICFSTFGEGERVVLSNGAQTNSGALWLLNQGATMVAESPVFHGIGAFLGGTLKYSYIENGETYTDSATPPLNISFKFAVARSTGAFTVDKLLTQANIAAALSSLNEYDRYDGVRIRLTATAINNDPTLTLNKVFWDVSHDQNYVHPNIQLSIRGIEAGETVDMCLLADDSIVRTFSVGGSQQFAGGANLDKQVYFNRRKSGILIYSTKYAPITLRRGNLGNIDLFAGSNVQLADASALVEQQERIATWVDDVRNQTDLLEPTYNNTNKINGLLATTI